MANILDPEELKKQYQRGKKIFDGVDLSTANLDGFELTRASFKGANFRHTSLVLSYLTRVDLSGANLAQAYLNQANLVGANLTGASLKEAYLIGAILLEATLFKADLSGAILIGANLFRADFNGAYYDKNTQFDDSFDPIKAGMQKIS